MCVCAGCDQKPDFPPGNDLHGRALRGRPLFGPTSAVCKEGAATEGPPMQVVTRWALSVASPALNHTRVCHARRIDQRRIRVPFEFACSNNYKAVKGS